jgi:predicted PurR-regulated permease PerM
MRDTVHWDITWTSLFRILVVVAGVFVVYQAREVVGALLIAIVVSLGIGPFVTVFERLRLGRLFGTFVVFLVGLLALATVVYFVIPVVAVEFGAFSGHLNSSLAYLFGNGFPALDLSNIGAWLSEAAGILGVSSASITGAIGSVVGRIVLFVATVVASFYLTVEKDGVERLIRAVLPDAYEGPVLSIMDHFRTKVRHWFRAQLELSLIVGVIVGLGSWALGLKYPLVLGLLAAVFELVPIIGPIVTGVVAFLVALADSFTLGISAVIFFVILQQLENHVLAPLIMGRSVEVHPVIVVVAILTGGTLAGIVGIILAVPLAVLAQEIFEHLTSEKRDRPVLGV